MPGGKNWLSFYRTSSGFLLRFPDLADFEVSTDGRRVTCVPVPGVSEAATEHLYLNQVVPLAISKHGKLVFHGSAVEVDGKAIAFVAPSGRGKSTLAASFAIKGQRFLTDDGLVLEGADGGYHVVPSDPSLRLRPDSHERLLNPNTQMLPPLDSTSKARVLAGTRLAYCDEPRQLRTAYFLGDGSATDVLFKRLSGVRALVAWSRHSFVLDVEDRALVSTHFDQTAALADHVVCYELDYPRRYEGLDDLVEAIVARATGMNGSP